MSENTTAAVETEIVEGQMDLFTGDVVETETVEETAEVLTVPQIVTELIGTATDYTPYGIAKLINQVFEVTSTEKVIPPQMMYIYASKGMIVKGAKGRKSYTADEVHAFVTKYTSKHVTI